MKLEKSNQPCVCAIVYMVNYNVNGCLLYMRAMYMFFVSIGISKCILLKETLPMPKIEGWLRS